MKNKILQEFLDSDIKIKSTEKLKKYIDYCLRNNQENRIKGETSHHHIVPDKLFETYNNLKENPWNGVHLMYCKHYKAHWLLTEAIDDYGQLLAFTKMHNCDIKNKRITEVDLIPEGEFQVKLEKAYKDREDFLRRPIEVGGLHTTRKKEACRKRVEKLTKPYFDDKGRLTSISKEASKKGAKTRKASGAEVLMVSNRFNTMTKKILDGNSQPINRFIESARKSAFTRTQMFINEDGVATSIAKESIKARNITMQKEQMYEGKKLSREKIRGKLISKAMNKEFYNENGNLTTVAKEAKKKELKTKIEKGRFFNIFNKGVLVSENVPQIKLKEIYSTLVRFTKNNWLGKSTKSKNWLIKKDLSHLVGLYVEEVSI